VHLVLNRTRGSCDNRVISTPCGGADYGTDEK